MPESPASPPRKDRQPGFDTSVAHPARVYDYWLGGKDNFAADREAGDQVIAAQPAILVGVRANRAFLRRTVRHLAGEMGVRQFLDIGTGIPAANNTHEVAQSLAPESRVVYVDNDPVVLVHARALLNSTEGPTAYLDADLRDTGKILKAAARTLDLSRPVAVMLLMILHLIPDSDDPYGIVRRLMDETAAGSYLALSHPASDIDADAAARATQRYNALVSTAQTRRTYAQVCRFFDSLDLLEPGVVATNRWRPADGVGSPGRAPNYAGVARKPAAG
ncbi:MAG TPA: SAM-dependent methyltransferase [Streptosporangiaceae bacterium]|nr:SAM-dependent methyltransferase [Streptosporangiaceae bacterium]